VARDDQQVEDGERGFTPASRSRISTPSSLEPHYSIAWRIVRARRAVKVFLGTMDTHTTSWANERSFTLCILSHR
jgi:hypothetical protein